jgi:hypothetical protein
MYLDIQIRGVYSCFNDEGQLLRGEDTMTKKEMISYLTNWGVYYENLLWDKCPLTIAQLRAEIEDTKRMDKEN